MFEAIKAFFFGLIEGITEWLPISSTGHLILFNNFIKLDVSSEFWSLFLIIIQLSAIAAVCTVFFKKLNFFMYYKKDKDKFNKIINIWKRIIIGCIPAGIIGVLFSDVIDKYFFNYLTVSIMLVLYGILFIVVENYIKKKNVKYTSLSEMPYKIVLYIGLFQVLSIIPGTSRSGAIIVGALLLGTSRIVATEFAFYLAIPVMLGASLLELLDFGFVFTSMEIIILLIGMISSYIVSVLCIKFLTNFVKKHDFKVFGWYRIVFGIILLIYYFLTIR